MIEAVATKTIEPIRRAFPAEKAKAWHYKIHPYYTKQPSNVVGEYIRHFCPEGGLVIDPFCGSGVTAIEALTNRRRTVCIDLDTHWQSLLPDRRALPPLTSMPTGKPTAK